MPLEPKKSPGPRLHPNTGRQTGPGAARTLAVPPDRRKQEFGAVDDYSEEKGQATEKTGPARLAATQALEPGAGGDSSTISSNATEESSGETATLPSTLSPGSVATALSIPAGTAGDLPPIQSQSATKPEELANPQPASMDSQSTEITVLVSIGAVSILLLAAAMLIRAHRRRKTIIIDEKDQVAQPEEPSFNLLKFGTARSGPNIFRPEPNPSTASPLSTPTEAFTMGASSKTQRASVSVTEPTEELLPETNFPEFFTPSSIPKQLHLDDPYDV